MIRIGFVLAVLGLTAALAGASAPSEDLGRYFPIEAAPGFHKPLFENAFVLALDVSIPAGATVPAHVHPWPAVFITLEPAHLVFRNLAGEIVRDVRPVAGAKSEPRVEWREPDAEPASVSNVGTSALHALRIELKFLAR